MGRPERLLRMLFAARAKKGPYRFLVRSWEDVDDIGVAKEVLATSWFKRSLVPAALPVAERRRLLVLSPHQDDEVIGAGGTLLIAAEAGAKIDIAFVTDGATGDGANVAVRRAEAEEVCGRLGARMHEIGISNESLAVREEHLDRLAALFADTRPDTVLLPWVLDAQGKHRFVNHVLATAHRRTPLENVEAWTYQVHNPLVPNGYVDITDVIAERTNLIRLYQSALEHQCYDHLATGMAAWNSRLLPPGRKPRFAELFFALPLGEHLRLVDRFYRRDLPATYCGYESALRAAKALEREFGR